jgi:hypothetical protein
MEAVLATAVHICVSRADSIVAGSYEYMLQDHAHKRYMLRQAAAKTPIHAIRLRRRVVAADCHTVVSVYRPTNALDAALGTLRRDATLLQRCVQRFVS